MIMIHQNHPPLETSNFGQHIFRPAHNYKSYRFYQGLILICHQIMFSEFGSYE